jgi:phage regulator Rha-like protein
MEQNLIKSEIESRIFTIRGMQVMLDSDLANLYVTETKFINRAVSRNPERFPTDFAFRLSNEEWSALRFQNGTLNETLSRGKHRKYSPFAFTEQGIAMLSAVLSTPVAIRISVEIIRSFIELRKRNHSLGIVFQKFNEIDKWKEETDLKLESLFKALCTNDFPSSGIFFNDKIFDAYVFSSELISKVKKSIILIDNYIDETTLLQLSKRNKKVRCTIYTERITDQLKLDLEKHNAQYPPIEVRILKNTHDRFLILDEKELYHIGASLKDLGKRWFAFSKLDGLVHEVLNHLR